jgi:nitrilase
MDAGGVRVAVVQEPPVLLDREATLAAAVGHLRRAADGGARLVVFPEAYVPGYPVWIWRLRPEADYELTSAIYRELLANSVDLVADGLRSLRDVAAERGVVVVCGIHEREGEFSRATLYNTLVTIGADGAVVNRHRKLMPTNPERMIWGRGDASGLNVVETPAGRLGTLLCWENYMPLARYALYAQNLEVLVAPTWDCGDEWVATMRHIAREGGCYVVGVGTAIQARDVPADFPERARIFPDPDDWLCDGDAVVVKPFGRIAAGPLRREKGTLFAEIDPELARRSRRSLDVTGHYSRPDIFRLTVNRGAMKPVEFE